MVRVRSQGSPDAYMQILATHNIEYSQCGILDNSGNAEY